MAMPLEGVRVLAVEQFGAGPWATLQLADLGAEIIKIEDPGNAGDVGRYVPPFQEGQDSLFFETFNRGKKSLALDLRSAEGRAVFHDLVRTSDAVFSNLRGDGPAKLGLTYDALREVNPRIVCVSLSGFGMTGPRVKEAGYDYIIQAMAGWMSLTGDPAGPAHEERPVARGPLRRIRRGDRDARRHPSRGPRRRGLRRRRLAVRDRPERAHVRRHLGRDARVRQPRGAPTAHTRRSCPSRRSPPPTATSRSPRARSASGAICARRSTAPTCSRIPATRASPRATSTATRSSPTSTPCSPPSRPSHWLTLLVDAGVPVGRVNDVAEALEDPQTLARDGVVAYEHPNLGTVRQAASPLRLSGELPEPSRAPLMGEHTDDLLRELLGYSDEQTAALREAGAFGEQVPQ